MLRAEDLVGTWRLMTWQADTEAGTIERPFGDRPQGYVVYTPDGHMITTISMSDREPIGGNLLSAPTEAQAVAFGSFTAYAGRFRIDGDDVIHEVELCLYPDWVGTEQRRHARFDEAKRRLTLSADLIPSSGPAMRHSLDWERVSG